MNALLEEEGIRLTDLVLWRLMIANGMVCQQALTTLSGVN